MTTGGERVKLKKFFPCVKTCCPFDVNESPDWVNAVFLYCVDLFTASKDKSVQAVDMNSGAVAHAINKAHRYVLCCVKSKYNLSSCN